MSTFYFGKPNKSSIFDIIDSFKPADFKSAKTSTLPLLEYWKKDSDRILYYNTSLKVKLSNPKICFEFPTASYSSNNPSYTDVCVFENKNGIFIEAKYQEKLYDKVSNWYDKSYNKRYVLKHWLNRINGFLQKKIIIKEIEKLNYQMLHRISSACCDNFNEANIIYQIFVDNQIDHVSIYRDELKKYKKLFDRKGYKRLIHLYLQKTNVRLIYDNLKTDELIKTIRKKRLYKIVKDEIYSV